MKRTKYIRIEMPDGSEWDIPAAAVDHHRSSYYATKESQGSMEKHTEIYDIEMECVLGDHKELIDWSENNMNWSAVSGLASLHKAATVDYQDDWVNGPKMIVEI